MTFGSETQVLSRISRLRTVKQRLYTASVSTNDAAITAKIELQLRLVNARISELNRIVLTHF